MMLVLVRVVSYSQIPVLTENIGDIVAAEGDLYKATDTGVLYLGMQSGELVAISTPSSLLTAAPKHAEFGFTANFNVNTDTGSVKGFFETEVSNEGAVVKTDNNTLSIVEAGLYQISFNCMLTTAIKKINVIGTLYIDGLPSKVVFANNYIQQAAGNNTSSFNFSYVSRFAVNASLAINTIREAKNGSVLAQSNASVFTITKLSD